MILRVVFIKLTFRWLQTGLSDLKNTKQLICLLMVAFLRIFKMLHFSNFFEIFLNSPVFPGKIVKCTYFI